MSESPDPAARAAKRLPWLLAGWGVSALLLIAAVAVLLFAHAPTIGLILFVLGAAGTAAVSIGLVRVRASVRSPGSF